MATTNGNAGPITSLRRYPVKSMMGEDVEVSLITERGLLGDRVHALIDMSDGKVVSAKNPKKWANLFAFSATYEEEPRSEADPMVVRITTPDGTVISSRNEDVGAILSRALGREVRLNRRERGQEGILETTLPNPWTPQLEEYWPEDVAGLAYSGVVTDEAMPEGTFFDLAPVHLVTTATLEKLQELYPDGDFNPRRFRPNLLVQTDDEVGFVENDWVGKTVQIGEEVQLQIMRPCPRCVMTTLPQRDLPKDVGILRAAAQHNDANVGVYASVVRGGQVRKGDQVRVL